MWAPIGNGTPAYFRADPVFDVSRLIALWRAGRIRRGSAGCCDPHTVGAINLPIIKFSVDWWNTLHQPASVMRMGGPSLDAPS